jgi:voltage-gated potassium channel
LRIFRVLRGVRAAKLIATFILNRRAEGAFLAAVLLALLLVGFSSIAVLQVEGSTPDANIKSAGDALWWAFVTITTVGYGDHFPISTEGRLIGALLVTAGVGLVGTFSGFVASWFLAPGQQKEETDIKALHRELQALRQALVPSSQPGAPTPPVNDPDPPMDQGGRPVIG